MDSSSGCMKPGEVIKPQLTSEDVPAILLELFGLKTSSVKPLISYDDLNFLIKVDASVSSQNEHISSIAPSGYILKVMNSLDSQEPAIVDGQNEMMLFLGERGYKCPVPQKTKSGNYSHRYYCQDPNKNEMKCHIIRLLVFVPDKILCTVPLSKDLIFSAGNYIAKLDQDLKDFTNPAVAARNFTWMMSNTSRVRQFMYAVTDPKKTKLLEEAFANWEEVVVPLMDELPKGYVHGDFNEQNILVCPTDASKDQTSYTVSGLIDFGDISMSCYVFELSILTMSFLTMENDIELAGHALAGYDVQRALTELEWHVIWECVCARLCMSLVLGAYTNMQDPSNLYVLTTSAKGWEALASLLQRGKASTVALWKQVQMQRKQ